MQIFIFFILPFIAVEFLLGFLSLQVLAQRQVRCALKVFLNLALLCIRLATWDPIVKPWNVLLIFLSCVRVRTNSVKINILKQLRVDIQPDRHCDPTSRVAPARYVILPDSYPLWHPLIEKIHTNNCTKKQNKTRQWHGIRIWHVLFPAHTDTNTLRITAFFCFIFCHSITGTAK